MWVCNFHNILYQTGELVTTFKFWFSKIKIIVLIFYFIWIPARIRWYFNRLKFTDLNSIKIPNFSPGKGAVLRRSGRPSWPTSPTFAPSRPARLGRTPMASKQAPEGGGGWRGRTDAGPVCPRSGSGSGPGMAHVAATLSRNECM